MSLRVLLLLFPMWLFAQQPLDSLPSPFPAVDSLYREDQFYLGITYNRLQQEPKGYSQNGLASGFHLGFLRDMPVNRERTVAVALGLGVSWNKYHHNMLIERSGGTRVYSVLEDVNYDRNKLEQLFVEAPLELRWRNSTPLTTKFWRIYAGFKLRYLAFSKATFDGPEQIKVFNNPDMAKWQYGPTLSVGYNTWNFHVYYGMNPLFDSGTLNGEKLDMRTLNLGLMFYIL